MKKSIHSCLLSQFFKDVGPGGVFPSKRVMGDVPLDGVAFLQLD